MTLTDQLVGYWKLDGDATDASGNGNDGTLINSPSFDSGVIGQAVSLDGTSQCVNVPDISGLSDFSVNIWMNPSRVMMGGGSDGGNLGNDPAFGADNYPTTPREGFIIRPYKSASTSANFEAYVGGTGGGTGYLFAASIFQMVTGVRSGTTVKFYLNGSYLSGNDITVGSGTCALQNIRFGAHYYSGANQELMQGLVDEAGIWSRTLSAAEISQLYNGGAGLAYPFVFPRSFGMIVG